MQLYFVRHGIAEDATETMTDAERQLTREGIHRTKTTARALMEASVKPRRLFTSPLARAHQTAEIIAQILDTKVTVRKALSPGFRTEDVARLIGNLRSDDRIMFVGHEPDLSTIISQLIGGGEVIMKKGSVARVDVGMIEEGQPLRGALIWLLPPRLLEK
ncbi:MAG: phosphohistidine phosphatase SixA [Chloroflexota bacterium]|nr:phosphohistidine phosphatase SixA [Chloroflexota bacterium]